MVLRQNHHVFPSIYRELEPVGVGDRKSTQF